MSFIRNILKPFHLIWNYSRLLAPARTIIEQAEDWTDVACAAGYVTLLVFLLYIGAISFSLEFMFALVGVAVAIILLRIAFRLFSIKLGK